MARGGGLQFKYDCHKRPCIPTQSNHFLSFATCHTYIREDPFVPTWKPHYVVCKSLQNNNINELKRVINLIKCLFSDSHTMHNKLETLIFPWIICNLRWLRCCNDVVRVFWVAAYKNHEVSGILVFLHITRCWDWIALKKEIILGVLEGMK